MAQRRSGRIGWFWPALLLGLTLLLTPLPAVADPLRGEVRWIYDGDTLEIAPLGTVRLVGIDTPETKASSRDAYYRRQFSIPPERLRQIAARSKRFLIATLKGQEVSVELARSPKDKYNRWLAYVYLKDGRMLNRILLEEGYACVFRRFDFAQKEVFMGLEEEARASGVGLWQTEGSMGRQ